MASSVRDITAADVPKAADTLARAFRADPMFMFIFASVKQYDQVAPWMFSTWVRWCMLYGKAWCTPNVEAVALRRKPGAYHMSFSSLIKADMLPTPVKLGLPTYRRFDMVIRTLQRKHKALLGSMSHWYCQNLAVLPEKQGQGLGKALMLHTFELAEAAGLPCYLETAAEKSLAVHERQGYETLDVITFPNTDLKMHLMLRPAGKRS